VIHPEDKIAGLGSISLIESPTLVLSMCIKIM